MAASPGAMMPTTQARCFLLSLNAFGFAYSLSVATLGVVILPRDHPTILGPPRHDALRQQAEFLSSGIGRRRLPVAARRRGTGGQGQGAAGGGRGDCVRWLRRDARRARVRLAALLHRRPDDLDRRPQH